MHQTCRVPVIRWQGEALPGIRDGGAVAVVMSFPLDDNIDKRENVGVSLVVLALPDELLSCWPLGVITGGTTGAVGEVANQRPTVTKPHQYPS